MNRQISRRNFVSLLGLIGTVGFSDVASGASSPAEALSQILKESRLGSESDKGRSPKNENAARLQGHESVGAENHRVTDNAEAIWDDLLLGNKRFVQGKPKQRASVIGRADLYNAEQPNVIVLGCADSRVSPELVFDKNLGELFVVRTAGNITDPVALGSIEYAAEHLQAKLIVVLGHERCSAVAAAAAGEKMSTPNLDAIVAKIAPVIEPFKICAQGDQLIGLAVEANARQSAREVVENSPVLQNRMLEGKLAIITAVYRLKTGQVYRLT